MLRHSYFFVDLQTILQEYGLACKNFFNLYNKVGRNGWDSAAFGIVRNVYNSPSYGVVHSGMGSYAHFHDVFLLLNPFSDRELPGRVIIPVWLFLCAFWRLCTP